MRHKATLAVLLAFISGAPAVYAGVRVSDFLVVAGSVNSSAAVPVSEAAVVAFNLTSFATSQTVTDRSGAFALPPLPAGVYRIIAFKDGFAPAITTIMPTRKLHNLALRLSEAGKISEDNRQKIWEIRRSLPPDVLRELDAVMAEPALARTPDADTQKLVGSMFSMTGFAPDTSTSASLAEAGVALHAPIGHGWGVGFEGRRQSLDPGMYATDTLAESTGVVLDVQSSSDSNFRFASSQSSWRLSPDPDPLKAAELRTHMIEWKGAETNVEVRYTEHQNVFSTSGTSEVMEVAGDTKVFRTANSDFGVTLRVAQEAVPGIGLIADHRIADVMTSGRFTAMPGLSFNYGLVTRVGGDRLEWIPQSSAAIRLGANTSFAVSGLYKFADVNDTSWHMPILTSISEADSTRQPYRYRYAVALTSGDPKSIRVEASAAVAEVDALLRVVMDDRFEQLWDGFDLSRGDIRKDVTITVRKALGNQLLVGVSAMAGTAENSMVRTLDRRYVAGDFQSFYSPSRTSLAVEYRYVGESLPDVTEEVAGTERLNLRVGQSLWLPLDLRLLMGVDLSKGNGISSEFIGTSGSIQKRLVGGVSLAF